MYRMTIVLAHGVFDVIHHGHIAFLAEAKKIGDKLVVSITDDQFVNKGPNRPVFTADQRTATLLALECVDKVVVSKSDNAIDVINAIKPDVYVKGAEYAYEDTNGMLTDEANAVIAHGGMLTFLDTPTDSSSRAINIDRPTISQDAQTWLANFEYDWVVVKSWLDIATKGSFAVIGEQILDRYEYVEPSGQSPKEGYTTYIPTGEVDEWNGGIEVISNHVEQVTANVSHAVDYNLFLVTKTRYVEKPFLKKVFSKAELPTWKDWAHLVPYDNYIVADFGHGLFDQELMDEVYMNSNWIAATIQANSLNFGFNRISKWNKLDYISCDRTELELANPANYAIGIDHAAQKMSIEHDSEYVAITLGHEGAKLFKTEWLTWPEIRSSYISSVSIPAFSDHAADRIGAGDAWFGWTAPLVRAGAPIEIIAFVGACAAAVHVSTIGNTASKANEVHGFMKAILA
tara:strand:- start:597 stop:1970 length:1374 start_codon:yes stop_codon:yes gene_type:complete